MSQNTPQTPARKDYRVFLKGPPTEPGAYWIETPPKGGKTLRQSLCLVVEIMPGQLSFMFAGRQQINLIDKMHPHVNHCPLYGLGENVALKRDAMSQAIANCLLVASSDREALLYLMQQFDSEVHQCEVCGNGDPTNDCDSAIYLRDYLQNIPGVPADAAGFKHIRNYKGENDQAHEVLDKLGVPRNRVIDADGNVEAITLADRIKDDSLEFKQFVQELDAAHAKLTEFGISDKGASLPDGGWTLCALPERIAELKYQTEQRFAHSAQMLEAAQGVIEEAHKTLDAFGIRRADWTTDPVKFLNIPERIKLLETNFPAEPTHPVDLG